MTFEERRKRAEDCLQKVTMTGSVFISTKQVAQALGYSSPTSARQYTYGCRKYGQKYYLPEVAEKIAAGGGYEI